MLALWLTLTALADNPAETRASRPDELVKPEREGPAGGLSFFALTQGRATSTSVLSLNPALNSQLVGELGGLNLTTVDGENTSGYAEYRTNAFFTYAPKLLDGKASLTAAFEVDFVAGDASYGTAGNGGGGFGGDQVNVQTRRLHATFAPDLGARHHLKIHTGLQFVADSVYDPTSARPDDLFRTGGGLKLFGSEAAGIGAYGIVDDASGELLRYRVGAFTLWESSVGARDDVTLFVADAQLTPAYATRIGLHVWGLRDRSLGKANGQLGSGPTSLLSGVQGGPFLDFQTPDGTAADVNLDSFYVTGDVGYNHALAEGPLGVRAAVTWNNTWFYITDVPDWNGYGFVADAEARYRWTAGAGSVIDAEVLYVSGDSPEIRGYGGVLSGNSYGAVGAMYATHGTYLLFPDTGAINRQVAVVYDVSNGGRGVLALTGGAGWDPVPNKLTARLGFGHAISEVSGDPLGTEGNLALTWHPLPLLDVSAVGAAVANTSQPALPWTVFANLNWLAF